MVQDKAKRIGAIFGIIILVIAACLVGRKMVNAVKPQVLTHETAPHQVEI